MSLILKIILMLAIDIIFVYLLFMGFYAIGIETGYPVILLGVAVIIAVVFIFLFYLAFFFYPTHTQINILSNRYFS